MGYFILFILNLCFPIVGIGIIVFFLLSPRRGLLKSLKTEVWERFVIKPVGQIPKQPIWLHAASVGEVKSIIKMAEALKNYYHRPIIVTTDTAAGKAAAVKELVFDKALLAPVDFYPLIKRFITIYKPQNLFVIEADLWPNMITACANNNIPVEILNGRMSMRSAKRYKFLNPLLKLVFSKIQLVCAQTQTVAQTYIFAGVPKAKVVVTGNIKYDTLNESPARSQDAVAIIKAIKWQGKIVTCGSTHEEEESVIITAAKKLKDINFIIAPRHLERKKQIINTLTQSGLKFAVLSHLKNHTITQPPQILLADAMGWLGGFYAIADIAFIGGSITKRGGHNFLEAAVLGKPVLFGQHYYNAPDVAAALLAKNGGGMLVGADNFVTIISKLMGNTVILKTAAKNAKITALSFKGATEKTINTVKKYERK